MSPEVKMLYNKFKCSGNSAEKKTGLVFGQLVDFCDSATLFTHLPLHRALFAGLLFIALCASCCRSVTYSFEVVELSIITFDVVVLLSIPKEVILLSLFHLRELCQSGVGAFAVAKHGGLRVGQIRCLVRSDVVVEGLPRLLANFV